MPQAPVLTARLLSHVERNDSFASNRTPLTPFFRKDPDFNRKFGNIVIFRSGKVMLTL